MIAANGGDGIHLYPGATANTILGNWIGTDATGAQALGNGEGIVVENAGNTVIGNGRDQRTGPCRGACNLISGQSGNGIHLLGDGTFSTSILGNFIGVDAGGTAALANHNGIFVDDATGNRIGGDTLEERNVIAGNRLYGVYISGAHATANEVLGNLIGPDVSAGAFVGNGLAGVEISDAPGNTIGDTTTEGRNIIAGNGGSGIAVTGAGATGNRLRGNEIHDNAELGIDLGDDGPTFNDPGDTTMAPIT